MLSTKHPHDHYLSLTVVRYWFRQTSRYHNHYLSLTVVRYWFRLTSRYHNELTSGVERTLDSNVTDNSSVMFSIQRKISFVMSIQRTIRLSSRPFMGQKVPRRVQLFLSLAPNMIPFCYRKHPTTCSLHTINNVSSFRCVWNNLVAGNNVVAGHFYSCVDPLGFWCDT